MGQLRMVPKDRPPQFVEVSGFGKRAQLENPGTGLVLRYGRFQLDIPPKVDPVLLRHLLCILGDLPC